MEKVKELIARIRLKLSGIDGIRQRRRVVSLLLEKREGEAQMLRSLAENEGNDRLSEVASRHEAKAEELRREERFLQSKEASLLRGVGAVGPRRVN